MPATPQFGGTNGVPELDMGQPGSARAAGNTAKYVLQVLESPAEVTRVPQKVPQQNVAFEDNMGFDSGAAEWRGTLKVSSDAVLGAIYSDLDRFQHGSSRVAGQLAAPSPLYIKPTRLTNSFGRVISESATLESWRTDGPVKRLSGSEPYLYAVGMTVRFKLLG